MDDNKKSTTIWLRPSVISRMDGWLEADNCQSRSEFVDKALRFYMAISAPRTTRPTSLGPSSPPFRARWTTTTIGSAVFFSSARWN